VAVCSACRAGFYHATEATAGSEPCIPCEQGKFSNKEGASSCAECGFRSTSRVGATECFTSETALTGWLKIIIIFLLIAIVCAIISCLEYRYRRCKDDKHETQSQGTPDAVDADGTAHPNDAIDADDTAQPNDASEPSPEPAELPTDDKGAEEAVPPALSKGTPDANP
jgi:hypothetical protein